MHTNCHFLLIIGVVKIKKNVAVDKKSSFIFCTRFGTQNAGNGISEFPDFKILWGSMPPDPPRLRGLVAPWLYSWLFFPNQLPTSNFIEAPGQYIIDKTSESNKSIQGFLRLTRFSEFYSKHLTYIWVQHATKVVCLGQVDLLNQQGSDVFRGKLQTEQT